MFPLVEPSSNKIVYNVRDAARKFCMFSMGSDLGTEVFIPCARH